MWRNRLIWGDKKYVLPSLLPEFAGKLDLIYIDPPFATGADFSFTSPVPQSDATFTKQPSIIEQKAYRDTWGRGLDSYQSRERMRPKAVDNWTAGLAPAVGLRQATWPSGRTRTAPSGPTPYRLIQAPVLSSNGPSGPTA
jgi:hypothetical protein